MAGGIMKRRTWFLMVLGSVLLFASGCSKTASVKNDEGIVPVAANAGKQLVKPDAIKGLFAGGEADRNR